jgi:nitrate/nitrite transporter NarK
VYKWCFLVFACLLTFGSYFCYDNPAALMSYLQDDMGLSTFEFQMLYAVYSFPNTVMTIFGGFLLDKYFGLKAGSCFFATLIFIGQCVFALGASVKTFWVMVLGRFIFGLGGETLGVAQNTYVAKVFAGGKISLAFGIALSVSRIGSAVNMAVEPQIAQDHGLAFALWVGAAICLISTLMSVVCALLFRFGEKRNRAMRINPAEQQNMSLRDIRYFPLELWLICAICLLFYCSVFPFISIATGYLTDRYGYSATTAGFIVGLPYTVSAAASPVFGYMVDRVGRNPLFTLLANMALAGIFLAFLLSTIDAVALFVLFGLVYSLLASALWPLVPKCIAPAQQATAYGVMTAVQNSGLCVFALASGALVDAKGYGAVIMMFLAQLALSCLICVWLIIVDIRKGGHLSRTNAAKNDIVDEHGTVISGADDVALLKAIEEDEEPQKPVVVVPKNSAQQRAAYLYKIGIRT